MSHATVMDHKMSRYEVEAREFNKTAKWGNICHACGRIFLDSEVTWRDAIWGVRDGEDWLIEVRNKCPHCGEIRSYQANDLQLHLPWDSGSLPSQ